MTKRIQKHSKDKLALFLKYSIQILQEKIWNILLEAYFLQKAATRI